MSELARLIDMIQTLIDNGSYHKRRGFRLADATPLFTSQHLLEEALELHAEIIASADHENSEAILEEAADTILMFLHLIQQQNISLPTLLEAAQRKLAATFTTDVSEVTAIGPGGTRRSRPPC